MDVETWLIAQSSTTAECVAGGVFPTPEGKLSVIDPLCTTEAEFFDVPTSGGKLLVVYQDGYEALFAIVFQAGEVTGGAHSLDVPVDGGAVSPVTPQSLFKLNSLRRELPQRYPLGHPNRQFPAPNLYIEHFEKYDEEDAEPLSATLPDGTLMPFIRSGYGDGRYPVFTLSDDQGSVLGVYCDFLGSEKTDNWIAPPGVTLK